MPPPASTAPSILLVTVLLGCLLGLVLVPAPLLAGLPLAEAAVSSDVLADAGDYGEASSDQLVGGGGKFTLPAEPMDDVERELRMLASLAPDDGGAGRRQTSEPDGEAQNQQQQQQQQQPDPANDDSEKKVNAKTWSRIRPPPCMDTNPSCREWATVGECSHAEQYMHANCKESCHLCNPLNRNDDGEGNKYIHQDYPGVVPEVEFAKAVIFRRSVDYKAIDINGRPTPIELEYVWEPHMCTVRVVDNLKSTDRYLARIRSKYDREINKYWADPKNYKAAAVVVPELCRNNDKLCPLWASWGMCEEKPRTMKDICPLACQICSSYLPGLAQKPTKQRLYKSFFERMDYEGMYAATWQRRIMMPPSFGADEGRDGNFGSYRVWGQSAKARAVRRHYGVDQIELKQWESTEMRQGREEWIYMFEDHPNDSDFSRYVVDFWDFLSSREADEALELLRERGVPANANGADGRGFGPKTKTVSKFLKNHVNGKPMVHRQSSRVFVRDLASHDPKDGNGNVLAPVLHKIVSKVELLTGIPSKYLEPQIKFEKFQKGDFQHPKLHYGDSVNATDARMRGALVSFDYSVGRLSEFANYGLPNNLEGGTDDIPPRTMNNPRLFGLTICLNDAPEDSWFNIVVSGNLIKCRKGLAALYPVVRTLVGTKYDEYKFAGTDAEIFNILDRNSRVEDDGSYIPENLNYVLEHPRYDGDGEVIMMQMYFRRFPNSKRWKDIPEMDVYTLDDRKVGGQPVESHDDIIKYIQNLVKGRRAEAAEDEQHRSMMKTIRTLPKGQLKKLQKKLEKALEMGNTNEVPARESIS